MPFARHPVPRLFGLPPGADFPDLLAQGLLQWMAGQPPEALARVELFVNTRRMQRRLREALSASGARLLPRLRLVTDLGQEAALSGLPPAVPPLRRRLELAQLVTGLLDRAPDLAPRSAAFDLADSLALLMDEMQGEGVDPAALAALDLTQHARHWQRSLAFIELVQRYFGPAAAAAPDLQARQRLAVGRLAARWAEAPPAHPVIVAGSTASRGSTALLMAAVARLPQGALVLPGFDFDLPAPVWAAMDDALTAEDHPQYRYRRLLDRLGQGPEAVRRWLPESAPVPARNRLVSLALRPAPVTDQWMAEAPGLGDPGPACAGLTLIEAPTPRDEALALALVLRQAAETGIRAALITPDRDLTRQVTAALDRWGILPDDSAGRPLALSAPGRLLRHVAALFGTRLTAEALVTLLRHPLTHSGAGRGEHLRHSRDLDLRLRRHGPAFPDPKALRAWAERRDGAEAGLRAWAEWLASCIDGLEDAAALPLADHVARHLDLAERLAAGPGRAAGVGMAAGALWDQAAGQAARATMQELLRESPAGGTMTPADYAALIEALLHGREVREPLQAHPRIMIWGTREARVQGADLVLLAGLNEAVWPALPAPDPWLSRRMRHDAGLLLPERRIGLAAHDFQQALGVAEVVLSRALRDAEAATVPSRWLNRLTNLLQGMPEGAPALEAMRARGGVWLDRAAALDRTVALVPPAPRPAPAPPPAARPTQLPVTAIERLIRDPYAIYARHILRLRALDPLHPRPDALLRGTVLHKVVEGFMAEGGLAAEGCARTRLLTLAARLLEDAVPWPAARRVWLARLDAVADSFLAREAGRPGTPLILEREGRIALPGTGFVLTARPDRIDEWPDGRLEILDYKTGAVPSAREQKHFARQLALEAAMATEGAFADLGRREVARITYVGLGAGAADAATEVTPAFCAEAWDGLRALIAAYADPAQGYAARRAPKSERFEGDYDHLARFGEWDLTDPPQTMPVGAAPEEDGNDG